MVADALWRQRSSDLQSEFQDNQGYIEIPIPLQIQKQAFRNDQVMLKGQHLYHTENTYSKDLTWAR